SRATPPSSPPRIGSMLLPPICQFFDRFDERSESLDAVQSNAARREYDLRIPVADSNTRSDITAERRRRVTHAALLVQRQPLAKRPARQASRTRRELVDVDLVMLADPVDIWGVPRADRIQTQIAKPHPDHAVWRKRDTHTSKTADAGYHDIVAQCDDRLEMDIS